MAHTNADFFKDHADAAGMERRTLEQVKASLANAKKYGSDREMALLMSRHGRLTDDARNYVAQYLEGK